MKTVAKLSAFLLCALCVATFAGEELQRKAPSQPQRGDLNGRAPFHGENAPAAAPYGVCAHLTWQEFPGRNKTFALCSVAGIGIVRCDFPWPDHERKLGEWTYAKTDTIVADAKVAGVAILPILDFWHGGYPRRFDDLEPWARHVRRVAEHYAEDISVFEIWNEQDGQRKDGLDNPTNYVAVLKAAFEAIREKAPSARVAIGGHSGVPLAYIENLYKLGAGAYFDIMNVHPYCIPDPPEGRLDKQLENLRSLMAKYGDAGKTIWITEIGWPTSEWKPNFDPKKDNPDYVGGVDESVSALYLSRALGIAFAEGVETFLPYELRDREHERYHREAYFGLCRNDFTPKPAFAAYAAFTAMRPAGSVQKGDRPWRDGDFFFPQWRRPDDADALRETDVRGPLGADAGMLWTTDKTLWKDGGVRRLVRFTSDKMRFFNHLGAEVWPERRDGGYEIGISDKPIFFVGGELAE